MITRKGAALGDAVGLATEFMNKDKIRILYGVGPIKFGKSEGLVLLKG